MYIEREILKKFEKLISVYPIIAVVGARQSGKTTFLKEHIKQKKAVYLLFDDPDIRKLFDEDIKKFEKQYIEGNEISILDEVQYCKNAGIKLKYLADNNKKLLITSSSEIILGKEVLSYLVGRVSILKLYPFSINEFLNAKNQKEFTQEVLKRNIWEHITYGGYPKVVITEDIEIKKTILKDLYDTMVLKDISKLFSIDEISSLEDFSRYLAVNTSNIISYSNISKNLQLPFRTIKKYLNAMEKSYLVLRIKPFFQNKTKEITKQPKIYFIDTGLRNVITKTFESDIRGELFENYILSELIKLGLNPKYWRTKTGAEVDFVIENEEGIIPVEVKIKSEKISRGMFSFINNYKPKKAFVVNYQKAEKKMKVDGCEVIFTDILGLKNSLVEKAG